MLKLSPTTTSGQRIVDGPQRTNLPGCRRGLQGSKHAADTTAYLHATESLHRYGYQLLMALDYDRITETGGVRITDEAASMVYTRYAIASDLARGRRTLEIGCASGVGLGLMASSAVSVIGGDIHLPMLRQARAHYGDRIPLAQFSATSLPFRENTFGLVLFLEATYYVGEFSTAINEIARVLRPDGIALFVNANPERPDFIRSPYSEHYHTASEFRAEFESRGFNVEVSGAFPLVANRESGRIKRVVSGVLPVARRAAEALRLVPRTLKGRARIKRLIYGRLRTLPLELPANFAARSELIPVLASPVNDYKVIYVIASRGQQQTGKR
jgi:ubiquinone/menaquinone biosynthesis C-methylase UbiE